MSDKEKIQDKYSFNNSSDNKSSSPISYILIAIIAILGIYWLILPGDETDPIITVEDDIKVIPKIIKTIKFKTSNFILPGIEIVIKDENNETKDILTTDVNGEASFDLNEIHSIEIKYIHDSYAILSDRSKSLEYANILQEDEINLHVMLDDSFTFFLKPVDLNTMKFLESASLSSENIIYKQTVSDNKFEVSISKEYLLEHNIKINNSINFLLSCKDYSSELTNIIVSKENMNKTFTVNLIKGLSQQFIISDMINSRPIKNINIKINNEKYAKTDENGAIIYKYEGTSVNNSIDISINVPEYLNFTQSIVLKNTTQPIKLYLNPIYFNLKLTDYGNPGNDLTENLIITNNGEEMTSTNKDGVYKIYLPSTNKDYNLLAFDDNDIYEKKSINIILSRDDIGTTINEEMFRKTSIIFNTTDDKNKSIEDVIFKINDQIIKTSIGTDGRLSADIPFSKDEIELHCSKDGYLDKHKRIKLNPGINKINFKMLPIIYFIKAFDFNTNIPINSLTFSNKDLLSTTYDINEGLYKLHFKKLDMFDIVVNDSESNYQKTSLSIDVNGKNLNKSSEVVMYELTYLNISFLDKNIEIPDVNVIIDKKKIGSSNSSGILNKLFEYNKPKISLSMKVDTYKVIDTVLNIVPGINDFSFQLNKLTPVTLILINSETKDKLSNIPLIINGKKILTDNVGSISYNPKFEGEKIKINYDDSDQDYYSNELIFDYSSKRANHKMEINPVAYLIVNTYYGASQTPFKNVSISIDDKIITSTDKNGYAKIRIDKYKIYKVSTIVETYEAINTELDINKSNTIIDMRLNILNQELKLVNVFGNPITNASITYGNYNTKVNKRGVATINPSYLNEPIEVRISSKTDIYRDTLIVYNFKKNNEKHSEILLTNPFNLNIIVNDKLGRPAEGTVSFNPPPNDKSTFLLDEGKASVKVYESRLYDISINAIIDESAIYHTTQFEVLLEKKNDTMRIIVENAIITAKTNNNVPIYITYLDDDSLEIESLIGNGTDELELPYFGEYKFSFTPRGFSYPKEEIRNINQFITNLDFSIDDNFANCIESKENSKFSESVSFCKQVSKGNKDYCSAQVEMAVIYSNELSDYIESANTWSNIISMSKQGICPVNYTYYETHAYIQTKIDNFEDTLLNDIWAKHSGSMDTSFDKYVSLCPIMGDNCNSGEQKLRKRILRSLSRLMEESFDSYNNTIDSEISSKLRDLNQLFYDSSKKYSELVPSTEISEFMDRIDKFRLD